VSVIGTDTYVYDEREQILDQMVKRIGHWPLGLRRGFNHDILCDSPDIEVLIEFLLKHDPVYQSYKRKEKFSRPAFYGALRHRRIVSDIVLQLRDDGKIFHLNSVWTLSVQFAEYVRATSPKKGRRQARIKNDNRSFHGKNNSTRGRLPQHIAA
jgi:hypothetical protein